MKKRIFVLMAAGLVFCGLRTETRAHCQIPCGIYDDEARLKFMEEDVETLRKSVGAINKESTAEKPDYNQLARWIGNKERHADHLREIVVEYFLTQRIKDTDQGYEKKLVALHKIIVLTVKAKQASDPSVVEDLGKAVSEFAGLYRPAKK